MRRPAKTGITKAADEVLESSFREITELIQSARQRAYQAVNEELVTLYWRVGRHISAKIASAEWGDGVVDRLARHLAQTQPGLRGFTRPNLFRMRQFYEAYPDAAIVSALLRQKNCGKTTCKNNKTVAPVPVKCGILWVTVPTTLRFPPGETANQGGPSFCHPHSGQNCPRAVVMSSGKCAGGARSHAIQFVQVFPDQAIVSALSTQLSWSHFMGLLPKDPLVRECYAGMPGFHVRLLYAEYDRV